VIPTPAMAASMAASAVFTMSREWIATDTVDLPTANFQASGDISPSKCSISLDSAALSASPDQRPQTEQSDISSVALSRNMDDLRRWVP
jgi:hypothetical protein